MIDANTLNAGMLSLLGEQDMPRRRGQQQGYLEIDGPSWLGYWWEWVYDPKIKACAWKKRCMKVCSVQQVVNKRVRTVTKTEAQRLFRELKLSKLEVDNGNPQSLATVAEFVAQKFLPSVIATRKRTGQEHYRYILDCHVLPALGSMRLRDVNADVVEPLLHQKLSAGFSAQTVTHIRNVISTVFKKAKRHKWYAGDSPTLDIELPEVVAKERTALTAAQVETLAAALPEPYDLVVKVLTRTGLRIGELCGLRWCRIDTEAGVLNVVENYINVYGKHLAPEARGGQYQTLKTKTSRRDIPLPVSLCFELSAWRARCESVDPQAPVFASSTGKPFNQHNVLDDILRPVCESLKLPRIGWHDLRHTAATLAEKDGLTPLERRRFMGHASDRMTDRYTHTDMEEVRKKFEKGKVN